MDSYLCMILQQLSSAITLLCSSILFTHDHYCYWEAGCHTNDIHYTELLAIEPTDLNSLQTLQARHPFILSVSQCRYMFMGDHACVTMYIFIHTKHDMTSCVHIFPACFSMSPAVAISACTRVMCHWIMRWHHHITSFIAFLMHNICHQLGPEYDTNHQLIDQ